MRFLTMLSAILILAFAGGCKLLDDMKTDQDEESFKGKSEESIFDPKVPKYVLSFHEIVKYPRASEIEKPIINNENKRIYININQFIHSSDIMDARLIEIPNNKDYYNLRLRLSRSGAIRWHSMAINFKGQEMAMLLDSHHILSFVPQPLESEDDEWVVLRGPFDAVTARGIMKNAPRNYGIFTPDPNRIF